MLYEVITIDPVYFEAAQELGRLLAKEEIRLVNGAGSIGLMRSVADAVLSAGGAVTGVRITSYNVCYTKLLRCCYC